MRRGRQDKLGAFLAYLKQCASAMPYCKMKTAGCGGACHEKGRRDIHGGLERLVIERQRLFGAQVDRLGALAHAVGLDVESNLLAVDEGAQA
jgi:hypothetical protein